MDLNRANSYSEVLEILKYVEEDDYNKIPQDFINILTDYSNKDYEFKFDPEKTLDEQNVSKTARVIIAMFFRDYWATDEQKKRILNVQKTEKMRLEEEKEKIYSTDIFKKKEPEAEVKNAMVEVKKESLFKKIKRWFKR